MQKILTVVVLLMLGCTLQAQDSSKVRLNFAKIYLEFCAAHQFALDAFSKNQYRR